MRTTTIKFIEKDMRGVKLIINSGDEVINFYTTKNLKIYISNHFDKYLNKRYLLIMYLFNTDYEKVCLVNQARKILDELKYFSAEKLAYLEKVPNFQGKRVIIFRYNFKYACGINSAIDTLKMEEFYTNEE